VYRHWDHEVGKNKLEVLEKKIQDSRKVIVVFSEDLLDDKFIRYCVHHAIIKKVGQENLIPVLLPGGKKLELLSVVEHVKFQEDWRTDEKKWHSLICAISDEG
jgi:hypothetical protein